jgi:hypothetical protein
MIFDERQLPTHAEPISSSDLREGSIYYALNYFDDKMLTPIMETVVFIGRDLEPGDSGQVYFQDIESYHRGVVYGAAVIEGECAQFSCGSENEIGHIFIFEKALNELIRCSLRRREMEPPSSCVARRENQFSSTSQTVGKTLSIRFDDPELQSRFVSALRVAGLSFDLSPDGTVTCTEADWPGVNGVANSIRTSFFRWYFICWKESDKSHRFWEEMRAAGLPFHVEHHDGRIVFLVPKGAEDLHRTVMNRII